MSCNIKGSTGSCQAHYQRHDTQAAHATGAATGSQVGDAGQYTDGNGNYDALTAHVNGILADGRNHGFPDGIDSYKPRIVQAMRHLQDAGIVTAKDPYEAEQQAEKWLMSHAGHDGVFSFGGGPDNEDDAARLSAQSGISREDINAVKFMFDTKHDAELTNQDNLSVSPADPVFQQLSDLFVTNGLFEHR